MMMRVGFAILCFVATAVCAGLTLRGAGWLLAGNGGLPDVILIAFFGVFTLVFLGLALLCLRFTWAFETKFPSTAPQAKGTGDISD
jgi:hypothetical protein